MVPEFSHQSTPLQPELLENLVCAQTGRGHSGGAQCCPPSPGSRPLPVGDHVFAGADDDDPRAGGQHRLHRRNQPAMGERRGRRGAPLVPRLPRGSPGQQAAAEGCSCRGIPAAGRSPHPRGQSALGLSPDRSGQSRREGSPPNPRNSAGSPLASCRPPFPPSAGLGPPGRAGSASLAPTYLVLIMARSESLHSGRARRSHQVQSAKSPGKKSAPQASGSSMGAGGPAAWLAAARRGSSAPCGSAPGAARAPARP